MQYYATKAPFNYASDKASAMEVLDTFFRSVGMRSLAGLRDWTGGNDRVWTTSNSSLSALLLNCQSDEARGSTVNDALGLGKTVGEGPEGKPLMISVYYPREFTAVNPKQPTILDARKLSDDNYFVSTGQNGGWGLSHSCSGKATPLPERVHGPLGQLNGDFSGEYIGPAGQLDPAKERLFPATCARFRNAQSVAQTAS